MKIFPKPLSEYFRFLQRGLLLLALVAVARFVMWPVFLVPYPQGTNFTSLTILSLILMAFYAVRAVGYFEGYRDVLATALVLALMTQVLIAGGILIDEYAGIETYYTDPAHGGSVQPLAHAAGHLVFGTLTLALALWAVGSAAFLVASKARKKALA